MCQVGWYRPAILAALSAWGAKAGYCKFEARLDDIEELMLKKENKEKGGRAFSRLFISDS